MSWLLYALITVTAILTLWTVLVALFFQKEIRAAMERDPAARNSLEVILTYAGLHALVFHRVAHALFKWHIPILPRMISQLSRHFSGIEIHPGATIGEGLFIDHGMGVVIGETSSIGKNVTLYQGVTLGGTGKEKGKRHPGIGDDVVIGAGAKVLGNISVGESSVIGANAVVIKDVPANSTVVGVPGRIAMREGKKISGISLEHTALPDPLAQAIDKLQHEINLIEEHMKHWRKSQGGQNKP